MKLIIKLSSGWRSKLIRNANIIDLYDLIFIEEPTKRFPNGHFEFSCILNEKLLSAYEKQFEPEKFQKRKNKLKF